MNPHSRRLRPFLFLLSCVVLFAAGAAAQQAFPDTANIANVRLWPGVAPGSENAPQQEKYSVYGSQGHRVFWNIATPMMTAFYATRPNGAAILIIPGGGYRQLYFDGPGLDVARWFNTQGVDAFILKYRLPGEGHVRGYTVSLQDAQRALRLIRSGVLSEHAGHKVDPSRIGVMGFSAGGHLSVVLGIYYGEKVYDPVDDADAQSARPDFMILGYPALGMPPADSSEREKVRMYQKYYVEDRVSPSTPPAFIYHGDDDSSVPYIVSVRLADSLKREGVPVELHIFHGAGHGFGWYDKGEEAALPDLCAAWLRARGLVPPMPSAR